MNKLFSNIFRPPFLVICFSVHVTFQVKLVVLEPGVYGYSITRHDLLATQSAQYHYLLSYFSGVTNDTLWHMPFVLLLPIMLLL